MEATQNKTEDDYIASLIKKPIRAAGETELEVKKNQLCRVNQNYRRLNERAKTTMKRFGQTWVLALKKASSRY